MTGFIGSGNMASAIIRGMIRSGVEAGSIGVYDIDENKTKALSAQLGVKAYLSADELVSECGTVVLAVKPNVFPVLLPDIRKSLEKNDPLIISIAAGKTIEYITSLLGYCPKLVRIMPNINAKVQAAISAFCGNERAGEEDKEFILDFCNAFGRGIEIAEKMCDIRWVITKF